MKKILLLLCLCLFIEEIASRELDKTFQLLPQPQSIELTSGKGINYWELSYILSSDTTSIPILGDMLNKLPRCPRKGKPIRLQLTSQHVPASPEGYMMEINEKGVCISARTMTGIFYGLPNFRTINGRQPGFQHTYSSHANHRLSGHFLSGRAL